MRTILRIMKTELRVLFFSPIAWFILVVFALQVGFQYIEAIDSMLRSQLLGYAPSRITSSLFSGQFGLASKMLKHLYLYIPLLTMGMISRELSSGSIQLLYSSPVSNFKIIIGKYFSVMLYGLMLIVIMVIPMGITCFGVKSPDIPLMLCSLLGVYLTILVYGAIGLFMSAITRYQVVAAIGTLAVLAILTSINTIGREIDFVRDLTYWLSITNRSSVFIDGMVSSKDLLYFLLVLSMFLALTIVRLQGERTKQTKVKVYSKFGIIIAATLLIGYVSSLPKLTLYYDVTATKSNTLSEVSQEIFSQIDDQLTITTYVNLFDGTYSKGSPGNRNWDLDKFSRYVRFKPGIQFKYVYYYSKEGDQYERHKSSKPEFSDEELMKRVCKIYDYDPKKFLTVEALSSAVDLSQEQGRLIRVLERENGSKAILRLYKDDYIDPFEAQMSAAFKTLVKKSPIIAFVTGHKERGGDNVGEKGYNSFVSDITFRYSLINNGFSIKNITLNEPVADDIDLLVIADMKSELSDSEKANYDRFVERGGNLLILGEPKRQQNMNALIEDFGLRLVDGIVVFPTKQYLDDVVITSLSTGVDRISDGFKKNRKIGANLVLPSTCALEIIDSTTNYRITEVAASPARGSWIENQTHDFVNEKSSFDEKDGEVMRSNALIYYLTREVSGKEQRIIVSGDADFMSNLELGTQRAGIESRNFLLSTELFRTLSNDEFPIDIQTVERPDNELYITKTTLPIVKYFLLIGLPICLLISCVVLLILRKRR